MRMGDVFLRGVVPFYSYVLPVGSLVIHSQVIINVFDSFGFLTKKLDEENFASHLLMKKPQPDQASTYLFIYGSTCSQINLSCRLNKA